MSGALKLVKACDRAGLEEEVGDTDTSGLRILAMVYDVFHVVASYNREVLDMVRIAAYRRASLPHPYEPA